MRYKSAHSQVPSSCCVSPVELPPRFSSCPRKSRGCHQVVDEIVGGSGSLCQCQQARATHAHAESTGVSPHRRVRLARESRAPIGQRRHRWSKQAKQLRLRLSALNFPRSRYYCTEGRSAKTTLAYHPGRLTAGSPGEPEIVASRGQDAENFSLSEPWFCEHPRSSRSVRRVEQEDARVSREPHSKAHDATNAGTSAALSSPRRRPDQSRPAPRKSSKRGGARKRCASLAERRRILLALSRPLRACVRKGL